jgi:hypothetical protein
VCDVIIEREYWDSGEETCNCDEINLNKMRQGFVARFSSNQTNFNFVALKFAGLEDHNILTDYAPRK